LARLLHERDSVGGALQGDAQVRTRMGDRLLEVVEVFVDGLGRVTREASVRIRVERDETAPGEHPEKCGVRCCAGTVPTIQDDSRRSPEYQVTIDVSDDGCEVAFNALRVGIDTAHRIQVFDRLRRWA
jgi:hypothetical protein